MWPDFSIKSILSGPSQLFYLGNLTDRIVKGGISWFYVVLYNVQKQENEQWPSQILYIYYFAVKRLACQSRRNLTHYTLQSNHKDAQFVALGSMQKIQKYCSHRLQFERFRDVHIVNLLETGSKID